MSLLDFAREHGAALLDPISEDAIVEFEQRSGLQLPLGLRSFYRTCGGTEEFTDTMWKIWPFNYLAPLNEYVRDEPNIECLIGHTECPPLTDYLAFCDALILLPIYAICSNPRNENYGRLISLSGDKEQWLAGPNTHFDDFVASLKVDWEGGLLQPRRHTEPLTAP